MVTVGSRPGDNGSSGTHTVVVHVLAAGLLPALLSAVLIAGCSQESAPSAIRDPVTEGPDHVGPMTDLHIECVGEGSPTVVLIAGLNTSGEVFTDLAGRLAGTTRTCWYDRACIGSSPQQAPEWPDPSPASQAGDLRGALTQQGIEGPYVVLGWSYGGIVAQAFVTQHRDVSVGLVLEDTSVREQFTEPVLMEVDDEVGVHWTEGGRDIDVEELRAQLLDLNFRKMPLVVLSQDASGIWGKAWLGFHDDLAARSRDGVHVVGIGSGHAMHEDVPDLVATAVEAVVAAAVDDAALGDCAEHFADAGGQCRDLDRP